MRKYLSLDKLIKLGQQLTTSPTISLLIIILLALCFRLFTLGKVVLIGYDESIYRFFVQTLGEKGIEGLRVLINNFAKDPVLAKGPLPFRIAYIYCGFGCWKIFGGDIFYSLTGISFIFAIGTIIISYLLLRKWFHPTVAFWATILLVISPLSTALGRRALQDSFFVFIVTLSLYCYHLCWEKKSILLYTSWSLILLLGFLTKESMIFLYPGYLLLAIYYQRNNLGKHHWPLLLPPIIAPAVYLAVSIFLAGSLPLYINTYLAYSRMQSTIEYAVRFQSGPWFRYLIDLLLISPLTYILAIVGISNFSLTSQDRHGRNLCLIYILSNLAIFSLMPIINVRFILFLDIPLRALAVLGIFFFSNKIDNMPQRYLITAAIFFIVIFIDIFQFYNIFIRANVYDPVTVYLIQATGLVR